MGRVGNIPTTYIQLTLWLDQQTKNINDLVISLEHSHGGHLHTQYSTVQYSTVQATVKFNYLQLTGSMLACHSLSIISCTHGCGCTLGWRSHAGRVVSGHTWGVGQPLAYA